MENLAKINNSYNDSKVIDSCSIFGVMDVSGKRFSGEGIIKAITNMHDRGNGLGGGFAVYGLYPEYANYYAFHIMYLSRQGQQETEFFLKDSFDLIFQEEVPTRPVSAITNPPMVYRYFLDIGKHATGNKEDDDYVVDRVMTINSTLHDSFVFSSGKDMAVFKGVGYPEEIADYFRLEQYEGYLWTAHGRFPTNSVGWWGGAHPFSILDWTVVHNGEISSYGINRRYLEQYGYKCTMHTDTEVVAYAVDLLVRKHGLPFEIVASILSSSLWEDIDRMPPNKQDLHRSLRQIYGSLLLNGPFTIIIAHQGEMVGLTDRIRLRPLTAGVKGSILYLSSEEAAIRLICRDLDQSWIPMGGQLVIGRLGEPINTPMTGIVNEASVAV
jgi:glutamate synthase domain-containing protein 1